MLSIGCLLSSSPHMACAIVDCDLSAIAISQDLFLILLHESVEFSNFVFDFFAAGLSLLMVIIQELAFKRTDQRLATLLLTKGDAILLTHQKLAEELGSAREVVSRNLKNFETQGILQLDRGKILILDRLALEKIASLGD
jgi:CRP/FNR family transcriptional regulator